MTEQTAHDVADWLASFPWLSRISPVKITFDHSSSQVMRSGKKKPESYYGAYYCYTGQYGANMDACRRGEKKPGETYEEWRYYLVGDPPKSHKYKIRMPDADEQRIVYRIAGDEGDWYVSSYMVGPIKPEFAEFHPFGLSFQLSRWPHEKFQQRIDHYDPAPGGRERLPIRIETLSQSIHGPATER